MSSSRIVLNFIILLTTVLLINSCSENHHSQNKEKNIVERIGIEVAVYKFHYKHGAKRMGEVIFKILKLN